ncbi:na(+)-translocating NADH-quinone reductase subunit D [Prevotella sp. CAG:891]|jgi:Na+-transporting NADH:ubiquinone oxidoreductase subunit D|nr:NADH:ubiquinone reductase (Na(+)-transporting) subunit D [Prevotellamassilia sp.]CDE86939.1 na(+)-translocating NADH-quinone reductase subunit D [Prevotella sp. CAG:891]
MSLFSKENREALTGPLNLNNPVTVQVLGICSALAVTSQLEPAIVMGLSVTVITAFANVIISLLRKTIPNRIRIIVQLVVVATLVTLVSQILKAYAYDVSVQLSVYVGLIITNCILMGRLEAFAMMNGPWESFLDGVGNGIGYAWILVAVGAVRELLGNGTLLGLRIIPECLYVENGGFYVNNGMMTMPAMALILVGCLIWLLRSFNKENAK